MTIFIVFGIMIGYITLRLIDEYIDRQIEYNETIKRSEFSKLFLRWLKEQDAYNHFLTNIHDKKCHPSSLGWSIERFKTCGEYLMRTEPNDFIKKAFLWKATKEKYTYWRNIDDEWEIFLWKKNIDIEKLSVTQIKKILNEMKNE